MSTLSQSVKPLTFQKINEITVKFENIACSYELYSYVYIELLEKMMLAQLVRTFSTICET
jgi:hypothetical protein